MTYAILGIDPGIKGAFALIEIDGPFLALIDVWDVPSHKVTKNRNAITEPVLGKVFRGINDHRHLLRQVYIEQVHAMPLQGTASTFAFGMAVGTLRGCVAALGVPLVSHTPTAWKRAVGLTRGDKDKARMLAASMFPDKAQYFELKKHLDRAEAALIAVAGHRLNSKDIGHWRIADP